MKTIEVIITEIEDFKLRNGGNYEDYYIGITNNIERRINENILIVNEHLNKGEYTQGNEVYTAECKNRDEAIKIERYFQNKKEKGMEKYNYRSFGNRKSKFIYCYKMDSNNKSIILSEISDNAKVMKQLIKRSKLILGYNDFIRNR